MWMNIQRIIRAPHCAHVVWLDLESNGRSELNKSILLIPCMCGDLTQDLVAEALATVRVQDVTSWVSENVGDTLQSKRRREFPRSQAQKPGTEIADPLADTG